MPDLQTDLTTLFLNLTISLKQKKKQESQKKVQRQAKMLTQQRKLLHTINVQTKKCTQERIK